jgi:hypothetical protein
MCTFINNKFMSHHLVLVLAVWVPMSEIHKGREGGGTNLDIVFIVSIKPGSPCNF